MPLAPPRDPEGLAADPVSVPLLLAQHFDSVCSHLQLLLDRKSEATTSRLHSYEVIGPELESRL